MPLHNNCGCSLEPVLDDFPGDTPLPDTVAVNEHGELGPILGGPDHEFTGPAALGPPGSPPSLEPWEWADDEVRVSLEPREARPGWGRDLTPGELGAISNYTGGGYKKLNEALREGRELTADQQELKGLLDSAIKKAGTFDKPATVWRGVNVPEPPLGAEGAFLQRAEREALVYNRLADWAEEHFKPGEEVTLGGFQSTSFGFLPAVNAAISRTSPGIIFEIRTRSGALLDDFSVFDDEAELLLGNETRYRVRKVLRRVQFEDLDNEVERTVVQLEVL